MANTEKVTLYDADYKVVGEVEMPKKMTGGVRAVRFKGKLYAEGMACEFVETPEEVNDECLQRH